jgi:hypothetical protein
LCHDAQLVENEALNSTIAVHEQLVLTQKMATAQALALAGLTKKPRVGSGGAGTVAKRMTKANPNCQGIITAATAAAVGGASAAAASAAASGSTGGAAGMAAAGGQPDMAPHALHPSTAKHISPGFDMGLLSQAAAAAASDAVMLSRQQAQQAAAAQQAQRQGSSGSMGYQAAGLGGGMAQMGNQGPRVMDLQQQQHLQLQHQHQQHLAGMAGDAAGGWGTATPSSAGFMEQNLGLQQGGGYSAAAAAAAGCAPGGAMQVHVAPAAVGTRGGAPGGPEQQQEAVRAMQLAALQGYLQV